MYKIIILDVDGTLTDGSIYYSESGIETKKFQVKDAAGILAAQAVDIQCMILTGRESYAVKRRAEDLSIKYVFQGIKEKEQFVINFMKENGIGKEEIAYLGDDLNDLKAMQMVGFVGCPKDAAVEVLQMADYISSYKGGQGAVRDILFHLLKELGVYEEAISKAYGGI